MAHPEPPKDARAMRRAVLGDAYVDAAVRAARPAVAEFQDYITETAWGVWARGGALRPRDRSLLVLAMTAALGRMEEFRTHATAAPRAGVTRQELDELPFQIAAYCGMPAGNAARRCLTETEAARTGGDEG
ncbi:carboxymuconolactone decarboxylase family protein [Streptomyces sp. KL109B]|uniref:carboxymuconolactone decarboxylase family protein n=1 Tax=Streptomyces sp. KL109B TaxID=3045155 RepID=UPI00278BCD95|nr:carboxymuconolactone decarboxylase family protein [Streptomyces sp. KL109B]